MNFIKKNVPGMLLCLLIAIPAWYLGKLFPVVGGPVLAILIGLLVAMVPRRPALQSGIGFTSKKVLQYAIVLLGFDMNLFHILQVGRQSLLIIVVTISTALIVAYLVKLVDSHAAAGRLTAEAMRKEHDAHAARQSKTGKKVPEQQYTQRTYEHHGHQADDWLVALAEGLNDDAQ